VDPGPRVQGEPFFRAEPLHHHCTALARRPAICDDRPRSRNEQGNLSSAQRHAGLLLLAALVLPGALAEGQQTDRVTADLPRQGAQSEPCEVLIEESRETGLSISVTGLPAVSANGQEVAFLSARGGYDGSSLIELLIVKPGRVSHRVVLEKIDGSAVDDPSILDQKQERLVKRRVDEAWKLLRGGVLRSRFVSRHWIS
jgi:hypothetical protein